MKKTKENKGITLVALVVTIVILLILAGISISALSGSGLFARANDAKIETKMSEIEEFATMKIYELYIENANNMDAVNDATIRTALKEILRYKGYKTSDETITSEKVNGLKIQDSTGQNNFDYISLLQQKNTTIKVDLDVTSKSKTYVEIYDNLYELIIKDKTVKVSREKYEGQVNSGNKENTYEIKLTPPASGITMTAGETPITSETAITPGALITIKSGNDIGTFAFNVKETTSSVTKNVDVKVTADPTYATDLSIAVEGGKDAEVAPCNTLQLVATKTPTTSTDTVGWNVKSGSATIDTTGLLTVNSDATIGSKIIVSATCNRKDGTTTTVGEKTLEITVQKSLTADNIVNIGNAADYFGKYVTNYIANTENGINYNNYNELVTNDEEKWKIFYIGDAGNGKNQIYLISSNYIHYDCMPLSPSGFAPYKSSNYTSNLNNVVDDYPDSNYVDSTTKFLNKMYFEYLEQSNKTSTYRNIQETAYMLDSEIWNAYANKYSDFAIGGPTIELFFKSYNEKNNKEFKEQNNKEQYQVKAVHNTGYDRSTNGGVSWQSNGPISTTDSIYVINNNVQSNGCFLASPGTWSEGTTGWAVQNVFNVWYDGHICWQWGSDLGQIQGFRPIICLSSDVKLEKYGENYKIVEDGRKEKIQTKYKYRYTGSYQEFEATETGYYKIECYGARGGKNNWNDSFIANYGLGGYAKGVIKLNKGDKLYLYVGENGADGVKQKYVLTETSFNGGGAGIGSSDNNDGGGAGGGATDVRLVPGDWDNFESLKSRIIVAGGGSGGATVQSNFTNKAGGSGGGLTAIGSIWKYSNIEVSNHPYNATQTTGYKFGIGQNGITKGNAGGAGAGGGYYGGYSSTDSPSGGAGGGSGYVSGYEGCNAISETSTENNIIHTNQSIHYSGKKFADIELKADVSYSGKIVIEYLGQNY